MEWIYGLGLGLGLVLGLAGPAGTSPNSDPAEKALEEGDRLLRSGYPVLALREYREAEESEAHRTEARLRIAFAHVELGDYDAADEALDEVLEKTPSHAEAVLLRARVRFWAERYDASWEWFRRYLAQFPDDAKVRMEYALSLAWGRRFNDALVEFDKLEASPEYAREARFRRGEVLAWKKEYEKARAVMRELLEDEESPLTLRSRCHVLLGDVLSWESELEAAKTEYRRAVSLNPRNEQGWLGLGKVLEWQDRLEEAKAAYAKAREAAPGSERALRALERVTGR